ncbi:hypothetical protein SETIT_8G090000v2 [Setaria italica]|uniref:Protein kinase domain-containing protein n=1 Tax=Setaria italica TaxID=4555 RepID=K3ZJ67_SETIT|nr:cysteine-rich receptor-like protein kinase 41 [Setaria italica]RCV37788.1 hypothetical protein SETIT_8G090000v2 [Setaria italica]
MVAEVMGASSESEPTLLSTLPNEVPLDFLREITSDFSDERRLSEDAFGTVYKGVLRNGQLVAVKKLAAYVQVPAGKRFLNAATNLMAVQHDNIVKLLSCCSESKKKVVEEKGRFVLVDMDECVLCYEFLHKESLHDYLSDSTRKTDWDTNFKIIKGICQGLSFLHEGMMLGRIVHLDLHPANILLDNNMVPKIANFGLSQLFDTDKSRTYTMNVMGLKGYMAPEYLYRGEISPQCDIYSLGVVIIEITTGEKNCSNDKDMAGRNFIDRIRQTWTDDHIASMYPLLRADRLVEVKACIHIGLECVDVNQKERPSIADIVDKLINGKFAVQA